MAKRRRAQSKSVMAVLFVLILSMLFSYATGEPNVASKKRIVATLRVRQSAFD